MGQYSSLKYVFQKLKYKFWVVEFRDCVGNVSVTFLSIACLLLIKYQQIDKGLAPMIKIIANRLFFHIFEQVLGCLLQSSSWFLLIQFSFSAKWWRPLAMTTLTPINPHVVNYIFNITHFILMTLFLPIFGIFLYWHYLLAFISLSSFLNLFSK